MEFTLSKKNKYKPIKHTSVPERGILIEIREKGKIRIYRWHDTPVELWTWDLGPGQPSRVDLRGLEHLPSKEQLKPALAMLTSWREQDRREKRELGGPGRPRDEIYDEYYKQWEESGHSSKVLKSLKEEYLGNNIDDNAEERFLRTMRRRKTERLKRD